jgi:hypothetical protein
MFSYIFLYLYKYNTIYWKKKLFRKKNDNFYFIYKIKIMADKLRFIKYILFNIGYTTSESLDGVELISISDDF